MAGRRGLFWLHFIPVLPHTTYANAGSATALLVVYHTPGPQFCIWLVLPLYRVLLLPYHVHIRADCLTRATFWAAGSISPVLPAHRPVLRFLHTTVLRCRFTRLLHTLPHTYLPRICAAHTFNSLYLPAAHSFFFPSCLPPAPLPCLPAVSRLPPRCL